jgi:TP901 family phage tail tape measure protein
VALPKAGLELVAENAGVYIDEMGRARDATGRFVKMTEDGADTISARGSAISGVFAGIGIAAVDMAVQAGGALVSFIGDSIGAAGDFEAGMNSFAAAAGSMGQAEVAEFKDLFLTLGKELPVSTAEVQDAAIALVRGGIDPAVVEAGALRDSLLFAAAAGMDLEKAAELTIKQLGTFVPVGASVEEQTRFMAESQELLVKAANASTLNVDSLGDAMLQAGGQARTAGLDYEDFVTTMGLISPAFGSASEAGTSFKNFLARLQPTTNPAKDAMYELGLWTEEAGSAFYDAQGNFIGMEQASELLQQATAGLTDQQKSLYLQTIFGNDAMGAAAALADGGAEAYQAFAGKMAEANGVNEQAAATQQGFNFQMENLMGSLEALQITLGTAVLPLLSSFISDYVTPGVNAITAFAESIFATDAPLTAFTDALGLNTLAQSELGQQAAEIADETLQRLTDAWNDDIMPAVQIAQEFFADKVIPILENLGAVALPLVDAALDIAAGFWEDVLVPAIEVAWKFIDGTLIPILTDLTEWMAENLPPAIEKASDFFTNTLFPAIHDIYDFIDANVIPILDALADVLVTVVGVALETAAQAWEKYLSPALDALVGFVGEHVNPVLEDLGGWLDTVTGGFDGIRDAAGWVIGRLGELADAIRNLPDLPDVFTPGSPTPFEIGLRGIADALVTVTPKVDDFGGSIGDLGSYTPDLQSLGMSSMSVDIGVRGTVGLAMKNDLGRFIDGRVDARVDARVAASERRRRGGG